MIVPTRGKYYAIRNCIEGVGDSVSPRPEKSKKKARDRARTDKWKRWQMRLEVIRLLPYVAEDCLSDSAIGAAYPLFDLYERAQFMDVAWARPLWRRRLGNLFACRLWENC
jgi:hypothetical protein